MQLWLSIALIAGFGIPHGAIDHLIYLEERESPAKLFYLWYIGAIVLYVAAWIIWPFWSLIFFLILSAYHFGQSQLSDSGIGKISFRAILYLCWGAAVIAALVLFNFHEVETLIASSETFLFAPIFKINIFLLIWICCLSIVLSALIYLGLFKKIDLERAGIELLLLLLIHLCFYLFPLIIAFTFFFVILHSFKVLNQEYAYLRQLRPQLNPVSFLLELLPFTILSIFGMAIIYMLLVSGWIPVSELLLSFILISVITLPHSVVMEYFYRRTALSP
jgi:Brp/Blh family beta-carotene 15,15'-monooxygenase